MLEAIAISAAGVWLALFVLVVFVSLVWASEQDSFFLGSAVIVVSAAIAQFAFSIPVISSIIANPFLLVVYIVVYTAFGALYAGMWRLPNFVRKNRDSIQNAYEEWKDRQTRGYERDWRSKVRDHVIGQEAVEQEPVDISFDTFLNSDSYKFSVRNNKDRVASWVLLWPASLTWELMHKPFIWLWNSVYFSLGEVFERINRDSARKVLEEKNK